MARRRSWAWVWVVAGLTTVSAACGGGGGDGDGTSATVASVADPSDAVVATDEPGAPLTGPGPTTRSTSAAAPTTTMTTTTTTTTITTTTTTTQPDEVTAAIAAGATVARRWTPDGLTGRLVEAVDGVYVVGAEVPAEGLEVALATASAAGRAPLGIAGPADEIDVGSDDWALVGLLDADDVMTMCAGSGTEPRPCVAESFPINMARVVDYRLANTGDGQEFVEVENDQSLTWRVARWAPEVAPTAPDPSPASGAGSSFGPEDCLDQTFGGPFLSRDSSGDDVRLLQQILIDLGFDVGSSGADGHFGAATEVAVKAWQGRSPLRVTGVMCSEDWQWLASDSESMIEGE